MTEFEADEHQHAVADAEILAAIGLTGLVQETDTPAELDVAVRTVNDDLEQRQIPIKVHVVPANPEVSLEAPKSGVARTSEQIRSGNLIRDAFTDPYMRRSGSSRRDVTESLRDHIAKLRQLRDDQSQNL